MLIHIIDRLSNVSLDLSLVCMVWTSFDLRFMIESTVLIMIGGLLSYIKHDPIMVGEESPHY